MALNPQTEAVDTTPVAADAAGAADAAAGGRFDATGGIDIQIIEMPRLRPAPRRETEAPAQQPRTARPRRARLAPNRQHPIDPGVAGAACTRCRMDAGDEDSESSDGNGERALAASVLQVIAEICAGVRPVHQSVTWTTAATHAQLARAHARSIALARRGAGNGNVVVVGVLAQRVAPTIIEACGTVVTKRADGGQRARALAVCLRQHNGGWWATALEL